MPLIYLNCPVGTFSGAAKNELAEELTAIALKVEGLPDTPFVRSTAWIYINEYPAANVFHGGTSLGTKVISVEVNAFKDGLVSASKKLLIKKFTASIRKHAGLKHYEPAPVYIILRDIQECDWGVFGETITLDDLQNPPADARAF